MTTEHQGRARNHTSPAAAPGSPRTRVRVRTRRRPAVAGSAALLALLVLGACTPADESDDVHVLAAFAPLEFLAHQISGPEASVTSLTTDGADPHSVELSPVQVTELESSDLVIYLSGLQPATDEAVQMVDPEHVVDTATVAHAQLPGDDAPPQVHPNDAHFWLDPLRFAAAGHEVAAELAALDPASAEDYHSRAEALEGELLELDEEYRAALSGCSGAMLVTSHEAFGYLTDRYDLEQVGVSGVDPEVEPSPARMREVADVIADTGVRTIFFEAMASPRVVEVLAEEVGVQTDVLDPMERGSGADYFEVMRTNLEALERGLTCTG